MKLRKPAPSVDFPKLETAVQAHWEKDQTFQQSLDKNSQAKRFTFYDGPPFATGLPHYGHLLQGTIKDVIPRFKTMQGYYVERRFGWDCHGLPVEYELEKELGIKGRQEILAMGVGKFNDACRSIVLRHTKEWEAATKRLGRWIDFKNDYKTMDRDYMESIWWVVKTLWDKELLYEGRKAMHICPRCATPLSNFEVSLNYKDRQDPAVYVKFPLKARPEVGLLAWTTTPWTVPANVLLAVNPEIVYAEVRVGDERYVAAEDRLEEIFDSQGEGYELLRTLDASELIGLRYEPPFPAAGLEGKHYEVVAAAAVTATEGTGILHVAPAFGAEDLAIGQAEGAAFMQHIDINGQITDEFAAYQGQHVLDANKGLIADLKQADRLYRADTIEHSYPHCWRCETPLLNFATASWFVAVTAIKERLVAENKQINWTPEHVRDGRFGQWLSGAADWAISRNRFWGNPLPIWRCENGHTTVIGSLDELEELSGQRPDDLHKQFVDEISFDCPECRALARRIPDVLDCWFESGSMPYAQKHYPFERADDFSQQYPADFVAEGLDQTRGWFYTLHVLGVALTDTHAFNNVITTGLILAEDGKKMSKRLKNYPEPAVIFEKYGADALRLYLMLSPLVRGGNLDFTEAGVAEVQRNFLGTLWNCYSFLTTYASVDRWQPTPAPQEPAHVLDRWILSRLHTVTTQTTDSLESFDLLGATKALNDFLDELSNWYVRRSRRRFWKSSDDADKFEAYATLYHVLTTFCRLAAPFAPMTTEHIYTELTGESSVHLADWPKPASAHHPELEARMAAAREAVSLGLAARSDAGLKQRQPLAEARIIDHTGELAGAGPDVIGIISEELNVKHVTVVAATDAATEKFVSESIQPVPAVIGPLFVKEAQKAIQTLKAGDYVQTDGTLSVLGRALPPDAYTIAYHSTGHFSVAGNIRYVVGLDTTLTPELKGEGTAREVIRHFQELRKQTGLSVEDRISAWIESSQPELRQSLETHQALIAEEILARSLEFAAPPDENTPTAKREFDGATVQIALVKV